MKDIKQVKRESIWDFYQRFKDLMGRMNFQFTDQQHHECFIVGLLPHVCTPLIQQKVVSQLEVLEIEMKSSLVGDNGAMAQYQTWLDSLIIQLEELTKGKEKQ